MADKKLQCKYIADSTDERCKLTRTEDGNFCHLHSNKLTSSDKPKFKAVDSETTAKKASPKSSPDTETEKKPKKKSTPKSSPENDSEKKADKPKKKQPVSKDV